MQTRILDGKRVAEEIKAEVSEELQKLHRQNLVPGLAAVLVGENPASRVYVGSKTHTCKKLGMHSETIELPSETTTDKLLEVIDRLNRADEIDGILVQLPLPDHIKEEIILSAVHPDKDVDGFHPENVGKLCSGKVGLAPCTPLGIMYLLKKEEITIKGAEAVVVGRSNIVGKPMALLLLHQHATVTLCHSRTRDLAAVCRRADILVAAVGRPALLTRDYLKQGVVVIDVGQNRIETPEEGIHLFGEDSERITKIKEKGYTLVGDVHPRDPIGVAAAVTPVPGGVGPLTIAQLMRNTVTACCMRRGLKVPGSRFQVSGYRLKVGG
ncbi:bifunctional 5,10-methylenetetrahydrofolate dehydrogenase/5,10-methenyltetrahydrofolate cyclohydrolase [Acidobacteria bacterium AH-259-G07]|nr:bifunctional 5,10-methylenetetrahydrofolate dehydrogenase/5,10-methenyltetrahydrofolate cyclohydrolase [Acidobacteria bacterium AH-259-L09]MDA2926264.1 bifunctional 5,10-methylenetetrahydrofolate dehydrogenase/5,10-methenyltetrahydrofolate cyclohydrolase [Acidobacteria bacterium AH-259-G07]